MRNAREYKSSVFAMLYEDKENLLDLYNGVNGTSLKNADDIIVNTLTDKDGVESGIFMKVKNDVSFIFDAYLNLYEHQSTVNGNIPLRMLLYVAKLIHVLVPGKELYREKAVLLPSPRFVVFYNGTKDMPAKVELKLSDQYKIQQKEPDLELKVTIYNIASDVGADILTKSRTLCEYTEFVERTRKALEGKDTDEARHKAMSEVIDQCISDGILEKLLKERRDEIMETSIFQYDQEAHEAALFQDGYETKQEELEKETENPTITISGQMQTEYKAASREDVPSLWSCLAPVRCMSGTVLMSPENLRK